MPRTGVNAQTKENEERARKLVADMKGITKRLDKVIADIATSDETSNAYWLEQQRTIRKLYDEARMIAKEWTNEQLPIAYRKAIRDEFTKIKEKNITTAKDINYKEFISSHYAKQSLRSLLNETLITYASGFKQGENTLLRLARVTQQVNVQEKAVNNNIADGFEEKATRKGASERLRKELLKKATDGKYITVIDKNGKPQQWKIETYADLVARTKLQEASAQAAINTAVSFGQDLVQVSSHNTLTPLCQEFEGKIFSISGKDPDFPPLEETTPFHPNCLHGLTVVTREGMEAQGTLDKFIAFSNGETGKYPTGKTFIPVSKRGDE